MADYDIATVGGGVGGSAVAKAMAEQGYRVLIVEREQGFKDRVRGEFIFPWGVAEAKALGVYDVLMRAGGHHPTYWTDYMGAATSDPSWGQGLSLTLRDARELRDALLANDDWDAAGHAYAAAHDRYFMPVHTATSWFTKLFLEPGREADEIRGRVFPQLGADPSILPDTLISGPDAAPPTEEQRARIFGQRTIAVPAAG